MTVEKADTDKVDLPEHWVADYGRVYERVGILKLEITLRPRFVSAFQRRVEMFFNCLFQMPMEEKIRRERGRPDAEYLKNMTWDHVQYLWESTRIVDYVPFLKIDVDHKEVPEPN